PIVTALELLRLRSGDSRPRELDVIERQVRHLQGLVDDLLDVSRITRGKIALDRQRLRVEDAIATAVEMVAPLLESSRHHLAIEVAPDLAVDADPSRLAQIIGNLLNNAAKYTDPGGHIEIRGERRGALVAIEIKDNGIGIPPEQVP